MEEKKETNQEHVKIYDKDMYISQEKLKTILFIVIAFLIGFIAGYFSRNVIDEGIENLEEKENVEVMENTNEE